MAIGFMSQVQERGSHLLELHRVYGAPYSTFLFIVGFSEGVKAPKDKILFRRKESLVSCMPEQRFQHHQPGSDPGGPGSSLLQWPERFLNTELC